MDWRFITKEDNKYCNLFGNGLSTRGVCAFNINDGKVKRDQWGGTCILTVGQILAFVTEVGVDSTGLGHWSWMFVGGGGKQTCVILEYQPCYPKRRTTRGETVWDQHTRYFEARGKVRDPQTMFKSDLLSLLRRWKDSGDETLLIGDFNENVYSGALATALAGDDLRMSELCYHTTGTPLPPTHNRGSVPINAIYGTVGLVCSAVALLPDRIGVGDHRVFIMHIKSDSILGDMFPHVLLATRRLLNCASDRIKNNYIQDLNQLSNRHLIFKKLLVIDQASPTISCAQVQLRMNKVNLELEQFMKPSEQTCHKFKHDNIEWSPQAGVWIK
jgi:hypothetical protein